jgi:hypothetical protein
VALIDPTSFRTSDGRTVADLSRDHPMLLVCLRHLGCTFSRQALADLRNQRRSIEQSGTRVVLVHLEHDDVAVPVFARYGLEDLPHISDPEAHVYESCGLERGGARQLFTPRVFWRAFRAALFDRHGAGWSGADVRRMPGTFLIERGRIARAFRHATSSDRPDYETLCRREMTVAGR